MALICNDNDLTNQLYCTLIDMKLTHLLQNSNARWLVLFQRNRRSKHVLNAKNTDLNAPLPQNSNAYTANLPIMYFDNIPKKRAMRRTYERDETIALVNKVAGTSLHGKQHITDSVFLKESNENFYWCENFHVDYPFGFWTIKEGSNIYVIYDWF